ncbi:thyrotropin-releasing hormone-degrading ectoenzyme isoform X1 [Lampetra fluviatilis]
MPSGVTLPSAPRQRREESRAPPGEGASPRGGERPAHTRATCDVWRACSQRARVTHSDASPKRSLPCDFRGIKRKSPTDETMYSPAMIALERIPDKSTSMMPMVADESHNGRPSHWADAATTRPRTRERHIAVHRRLVMVFAISLVALIVVTILAVLLSVNLEACPPPSSPPDEAQQPATARQRQQRAEGAPSLTTATPAAENQPWENARLPGTLAPRHYDLRLSTFMDNFTYAGQVGVVLECLRSTPYVILHCDRLNISRIALSPVNVSRHSSTKIQDYFLYPKHQFFVILLNKSFSAGDVVFLNITFQGIISDELLGFFRSSYSTQGTRRYLGVTQFSPTHARKAFPCFDEPLYKATFTLSLHHADAMLALSNMPLASQEPAPEPGWVVDHFERSPPMSTYFFAWALCDFEYREGITRNGIKVRLYARPEAVRRGSADSALNITLQLLDFYHDFFNLSYSLPKLDLLAVPKHPYAAMENWGLNVFVEQNILLDPGISSTHYWLEATMVIAHEICHQWFGDLVTPMWWEDVWLKEGFAHYFEYLGTDFLYPHWNMETQRFLIDDLHNIMLPDGLCSSHPISQEVSQPEDISRVFDWIAYKKGAALIRMLANFMGKASFKKGLQNYLKTYMFGNAGRDDLWNTLSKVSRENGDTHNIREVMDIWTLQMGYPVVTINRDAGPDCKLRISQEHFLYSADVNANCQNDSLWQILLTLSAGNTTGLWKHEMIWITNQTECVTMKHVIGSDWLLGNINQTGYFRVNYDLRNWEQLVKQLTTDHKVISVGNRAGLIDDSFNLARAGYLPQELALRLSRYLRREWDALPWQAARNVLEYLDKILDRTPGHLLLSEFVLQQVTPVYRTVGWPGNDTEDDSPYHMQELQQQVIALACHYSLRDCQDQAMSLLSRWMADGVNRIPPNVRGLVYCVAVSLSGQDVWDFVWKTCQATSAVSERTLLLEALTCSRDNTTIQRLLSTSLHQDLIAEQEAVDLIINIAHNPVGRSLAWAFLRDKWPILNQRYGEALFMTAGLINGVTRFLSMSEELEELQQFTQQQLSAQGQPNPAFGPALELVEANLRWREANEDNLTAWLEKELHASQHQNHLL